MNTDEHGLKRFTSYAVEMVIYCISTNSGNNWTTNTEPQKDSTFGSWWFVASSADGSKLAGVNNSAIWISTNGGMTWLSNNVSGNFFFDSVAFSADGNKMVAVVGNNYSAGPIYTSTNSGITLTPTLAPTNNWMAVASSADGTKLAAVAASEDIPTSLAGDVIYFSGDSGQTWTQSHAPTNEIWDAIASSADGSKLVAATEAAFVPNEIYGGIFTSTNFGLDWTSNNVPNEEWVSVASSADGTKLVATAVTPNACIYTSTDSGTTWISNNAPSVNWNFNSAASSADGTKLFAAPLPFNPEPIYTLQTTPAPLMNVTPTNGNLALSWIVPSTNFVVQQSPDLASWTDLTNVPALNLTNLQDEVDLPMTNSAGFFRLSTE